jgi:hypothetical protein
MYKNLKDEVESARLKEMATFSEMSAPPPIFLSNLKLLIIPMQSQAGLYLYNMMIQPSS